MSSANRFTDPDARLLCWGWLAFAAWTPIGAVQLWQAWRAGEEALAGVALTAPLWAAWLLWLLWRAAGVARQWAVHRAWGRWHGNYFEFDGRQVRVVFDDDDVYVAAADVFAVLGTDARGRTLQRARLAAGGDGRVELQQSGLLVFSEAGLRAWMQRRTDKTALRFMAWLSNEVVAPHRARRRALLEVADRHTQPR